MQSISVDPATMLKMDPTNQPDKLSAAIIEYVEEVLTQIFRDITPPPPTPPISAKLQELRLRRFPMWRRNRTIERKGSRDRFLSELYKLHYELDGHSSSTSALTGTAPSGASGFISWGEQNSDGIASFLLQQDLGFASTVDRVHRTPDPFKLPYSAPAQLRSSTKVVAFRYDERWQQKLKDPGLDEIVKSIEESARRFVEGSEHNWTFTMSEEPDVEVPSWMRDVMKVSIDTDDFDEKVNLWDLLDKSLRENLAATANSYPASMQQRIREFLDAFFLKLDVK